jgi:uncharacterized protein YcaQ
MKNSIQPVIKISKIQARRFMLWHQGLLSPRQWQGKTGIMEYIRRVGCIQFDPVNVIAHNPELVLQARVREYKPVLLDELLYTDRELVDGFDKMAAIYPVTDWPAFAHHRRQVEEFHTRRADLEADFMTGLIESIRWRGPISSLDLEKTVRITGYWGAQMHIERYALERLLDLGLLIIHHRTGSRRYYDLAERVLPPPVYFAAEPFTDFESYQDWHVLRRIGGIGITTSAAGECWGGIAGTKSPGRWDALRRLVSKGKVLPVEIDSASDRTFFIRSCDWERYSAAHNSDLNDSTCIFLGPLDNLLWDRDLIRMLFDFDYVWEVYKPIATRSYGPYTLPILLGDAFVGRIDLKLDRKNKTLLLNHLWWEQNEVLDARLQAAFAAGLNEFRRFSSADRIQLSAEMKNSPINYLEGVLDKLA